MQKEIKTEHTTYINTEIKNTTADITKKITKQQKHNERTNDIQKEQHTQVKK